MKENIVNLIRLPTVGYAFDRNEHSPGLLDLKAGIDSGLVPGFLAVISDLAGTYPSEWDRLLVENASVYGISAMSPHRELAITLAKMLKTRNPKARVVVGGKDPSARPIAYSSEPSIDAVFRFEADETLPNYLNNLPIVDGDKKVIEPSKPPDINKIPAYSLEGIPEYGRKVGGRLTTSFTFARGCPFYCRFCTAGSAPAEYKRVRTYSSERNSSLIRDAFNRGYRAAFVRDDNFGYPGLKSYYSRILGEMSAGNMIFRFNMAAAMDPSYEKFREIFKMGGRIVDIALESGDPIVLNRMNKKHTPQQYVEAVTRAREAGLVVYSYVMLGFPGETEKSDELTIKVLGEARPDFTLAFPFVPYAGTVVGDNRAAWGYPPEEDKAPIHVCNRASERVVNESNDPLQIRIQRILEEVKQFETRPDKPYELFEPIVWDVDRFNKELADLV